MSYGASWWDIRQTLIWIATRDSAWVHELRPKPGLFGREERRDAFDFDFAGARLQHDVLQRYVENDGPTLLKTDLIDALAGGALVAVEHGAKLAASNFLKASVGDDYVGTFHTGVLSIFRLDWRAIDGPVVTADAPYWQPMFLAEQVREVFPPVASKPSPISEAGMALLTNLEEGSYRSVALELNVETKIGVTAEPRFADKYNAAQEPGGDVRGAADATGFVGEETDDEALACANTKGSWADARRAWELELSEVRNGIRRQRSQKKLEAEYPALFHISRKTIRSWIVGTRRRGRPPSGGA